MKTKCNVCCFYLYLYVEARYQNRPNNQKSSNLFKKKKKFSLGNSLVKKRNERNEKEGATSWSEYRADDFKNWREKEQERKRKELPSNWLELASSSRNLREGMCGNSGRITNSLFAIAPSILFVFVMPKCTFRNSQWPELFESVLYSMTLLYFQAIQCALDTFSPMCDGGIQDPHCKLPGR